MKRLALSIAALGLIVLATLAQTTPISGFGSRDLQAPATNTPHSPAATLPPTNTPRADDSSAVDSSSPTLTVAPPADTQTPTRTLTPSRTPSTTPSPTPTTIGPVTYPDNINTLTGLPFPDDAAKNRSNLIVKVSNYTWVVRPQSGLSAADIVWEYEVEGGVTRFAAIFRSQGSDHVGSIRSGRLPDLELVPMYQGLLAYSGSNDNIKAMILKGSCIDPDTGSRVLCDSNPNNKLIPTTLWKFQAFTPQFGTNCPPFCRFPRPGLAFEHTLFLNTFQLWDLATKYGVNKGLPARGFAFADTPVPGGKTASDIAIKWYGDQDARWQYNPSDHLYYRWNTGLPHVDANTGKQLTADNVIIMEAPHKARPDIYENETRSPTIEVQIWGQGPAWIFRDGQWYQGLWMHRNREHGALMITTQNGLAPIPLKPGNSWVEVVRQLSANVKTSDTLVDVQSTATYAAMTATAKFPALPGDRLTQTAIVAQKTLSVSEATAGYSNSTGNQGTPADSSSNATATPTAQGQGLLMP